MHLGSMDLALSAGFGLGRTTTYEMAARGDLRIHRNGSASLIKAKVLIEGGKAREK